MPIISLTTCALAFLSGICIPFVFIKLPEASVLYGCATLAILLFVTKQKFAQTVAIALLGFSYMCWQVTVQQSKILPEQFEKQVITVQGKILSAVTIKDTIARYTSVPQRKKKFNFVVESTDIAWEHPGIVQLSWADAPKRLNPGDTWKFKVKLNRPRSYANPGSFNLELYSLQQHISAIGYVIPRQHHTFIKSDTAAALLSNIRQRGYELINSTDAKYKGIITALIFGNKYAIPADQSLTLQNTGTAHLMSISGMHIALVAGLVYCIINLITRRYYWAAVAAILTAVSYALISGAAIATQRAVIMLALGMSVLLLQRRSTAWQRYYIAMLLVLIWDPLIVLAPGFWLSFLAVASLIYVYTDRVAATTNWYQRLILPQLVIGFVLLPLSLGVFGQISMVSVITNLIAIPAVTLIILPFSLFGIILLPIYNEFAHLFIVAADNSLQLLFLFLEKFNNIEPYFWHAPERYEILLLIIATLSAFWLFAPKGAPRRYWALLGFVPLFFGNYTTIANGTAEFTLLDVGQGLAAVIRTKNHTLVYDTGAKISDDFDLGSKVLVPYLRRVGVKEIDKLLISHSDNDHIGGAQSLIENIPIYEVLLNDLDKLQHANIIPCMGTQQWVWDDVTFTILHPTSGKNYKKRNDQSCVLLMQAKDQKLLLTGDIETKAEHELVARYGSQLNSLVMLVPHHGSKTSSSLELLQQVQPKYALVPVGYKNQYGHPKQDIMQRYNDLGIEVVSTAKSGAISMLLGSEQNTLRTYRDEHRVWFNIG